MVHSIGKADLVFLSIVEIMDGIINFNQMWLKLKLAINYKSLCI